LPKSFELRPDPKACFGVLTTEDTENCTEKRKRRFGLKPQMAVWVLPAWVSLCATNMQNLVFRKDFSSAFGCGLPRWVFLCALSVLCGEIGLSRLRPGSPLLCRLSLAPSAPLRERLFSVRSVPPWWEAGSLDDDDEDDDEDD